jgi:alpha-D-ribose 1-methylphosphonate 5-triphosphate synthase subunit PhnH
MFTQLNLFHVTTETVTNITILNKQILDAPQKPIYFHYYYYYHLLSQVSFPQVLLFLKQWCTPPLRLQVSDGSTFLTMCDVLRTVFLVENLLNALVRITVASGAPMNTDMKIVSYSTFPEFLYIDFYILISFQPPHI